ncbi:guanylate kinase [Nitratifractor sp.]
MSGAILILSGPSGAGKSTIIQRAEPRIGDFYFSISTTTRPPREGERDGVDYYFVSREEFEREIAAGEFLEYAQVHGNYYGTSLRPVREALKEGKLVIFDIDVQGHRLARAKMGDLITSAFITPPSLAELERRLSARSTDDPETIRRRLENAREEIQALEEYDFLIVNDELEQATEAFVAIARAARLKPGKEAARRFRERWLAEG